MEPMFLRVRAPEQTDGGASLGSGFKESATDVRIDRICEQK